jgi:hypothetical protein
MTSRYTPLLTLLLLAPVIGEVLFGSIPLSRLPFGLVGVLGLYGGGAVLVREVVRRRRLGSIWLVLLGLAYGLVEEGLVVQSLFNQHYPGLAFLGFYGHWAGVNWVWLEFIVPYHAVFSIAIPILVTELLFPEQRDEPWLGPVELLSVVSVFVANALLLAVLKFGLLTACAPATSLGANVGAALVAAGIIGAALLAKPRRESVAGVPEAPASQRRLRLIGILSGLGWFIGLRVLLIGDGKLAPAAVVLMGGLIIGALAWWRVAHWSSDRRGWGPAQTYALISGALPTSWLLGILIAAVSDGSPVINLGGHLLFGVLLMVSLRHLGNRENFQAAPP